VVVSARKVLKTRPKDFTVTIFHTPQPGFQYEAHIYHRDVKLYVAGGMTDEEAEQAARAWIQNHYGPPISKRTQVRSFTVAASQDPEVGRISL
jgi:3-hydroxy-3-methylglutaryl CoA synthase